MKVKSSKNGSACTLTVEGKIDTMTAPELDEAVKSNLPKCDKMIFDFTNVEYITSAGLRVLVYAQRELMKKGGVTVTGVNESIKKIFTVTGMYKILKIK
jgi:anti-sigma B factor antagonist